MKTLEQTKQTVEEYAFNLLSQMKIEIEKQKGELSVHWTVEYRKEIIDGYMGLPLVFGGDLEHVTDEQCIRSHFEGIVFGDNDVCEKVLVSFVEDNELNEFFELSDTVFIDEARNMQHDVIDFLVEEHI
ncbi:hypothetical protein [Vibrio splendidus]|uniref:hypothetical protein n=1 Tax=Vibrio splendidus TaxID=29497 RepID=UPI000C865073|nr:hypothetical protein [Vibrio splendidus]PMK06166.1 hypothetical protein BCU08_17520 [Vibrio splendidus]